jgi:protein-S-isoprenylcysteine O-methyltransferase Ste14
MAKKIMGVFAGVVVFIILPVVGWGVFAVREFLAEPARLVYVLAAFIDAIYVVAVIPNQGKGYGQGQRVVRAQHVAMVMMQIVAIAAVVIPPFCDRRGIWVVNSSAVRWLGVALFSAGVSVLNWATLVLGRYFSTEVTLQEAHQLVTSGPYRWIRHPRYTGIVTFILGVAMVFRSAAGGALALVMLAILLWRIHDEEKFMEESFGDAWRQYRSRSKMLLPYLI